MFAELDTFGIIIFTFFCFLVITHSRGRWRRVAYNVNWFTRRIMPTGVDSMLQRITQLEISINVEEEKVLLFVSALINWEFQMRTRCVLVFFSLVGHTFADLFPWREIQLIKSQILPVMWRKNSRLFMQLTVLFFFSSACRNLIV